MNCRRKSILALSAACGSIAFSAPSQAAALQESSPFALSSSIQKVGEKQWLTLKPLEMALREQKSDDQGREPNDRQDGTHRIYRYLTIFGGQNWLILGSEDPRSGWGFSYGYARKEPRLKWWGMDGELIWEGYYLRSDSDGVNGLPPVPTHAYGLLLTARYRWKWGRAYGVYFDYGFGVQYVDRTSNDLTLHWNTTPALGYGLLMRKGPDEYHFGVRLLHASNGGRRLPNPGQNFAVATFGVRF